VDAFKNESLLFTQFHVSPFCSPTRSALMSGRHEFKNEVTHTIRGRERMSLKTFTLPQMLKTAGYTSGVFGKWYLGDEAAYRPESRGFDEGYKLSPKLAQKLAQSTVSEGLESSPSVSESEDHETKKAPKNQGFNAICRLMSSLGISIGVDDIGLEPTTPTMSTWCSNQLS